MDAAQWPQGIGVVKAVEAPRPEKKPRPQKEKALNCPRCNSTNTKFCYYNNYSLAQPRYFCKTCRRYWTEGGTLRNVPVGGGSRKTKRSSASSSSSSSSTSSAANSKKSMLPDLTFPPGQNPNKINVSSHDLNLGFPPSMDFLKNAGLMINPSSLMAMPHPMTTNLSSDCGAIFMTSSSSPAGGTTTVQPDINNLHAYKPTLNFSLEGFEGNGGYNNLQQESNAKSFFPFEDLKNNVSTSSDQFDNQRQEDHPHHHQSSGGYWSGMLGGGTW